jgi:hypothetical protein
MFNGISQATLRTLVKVMISQLNKMHFLIAAHTTHNEELTLIWVALDIFEIESLLAFKTLKLQYLESYD